MLSLSALKGEGSGGSRGPCAMQSAFLRAKKAKQTRAAMASPRQKRASLARGAARDRTQPHTGGLPGMSTSMIEEHNL